MMRFLFLLVLITTVLPAQMEKRVRVLYDREAFRKLAPAVGAVLPALDLRGLDGKKVSLTTLAAKRRLVIIGGAFT